MKALFLAFGIAALAGAQARADEVDPVMAERWQDLKHAVFGEREVADGAGVVVLDAPARALDAALVPIGVTLPHPEGAAPADRIKAVYILVDGNPAPLAGTFHFGPQADPHSLKLRVRVDQYTLMHAVAETEDGRLFASERFVKAAGGCSAPSMKDPGFAMSRIGKMRIKMDPGVSAVEGQPATAQLLIIHPNNNGMQVDQISHNFIPPRYIQEVDVRYGGQQVFTLDADISLSEDPVITFGFVPANHGPLHVELQDSTRAVFQQDFVLTSDRS